jgi:hypothetical protein
MSLEQKERTRTVTVLQGEELVLRKGNLLKITVYPWGVEFDLPQKEGQE